MEKTITVKYPGSLASSLKMADREFEKEIKLISLMKLYELGKISSGMASKILGISRIDFIEKIGDYKISIFNFRDKDELKEEIENA